MTRVPNIHRLSRRRKLDKLIASLRYEDKVVDMTGQRVDLGVSVRCEAVLALGEIDDPAAIQAVSTVAVEDEDERVRQAAASALVSLLTRLERPEARTADPSRDSGGSAGDQPAVGSYSSAPVHLARTILLTGDEQLIGDHKRLLCKALSGDSDADLDGVIFHEMVQVLTDPRPQVVDHAVRMIVIHGDDRVDRLIEVLQDPARAASAARALGEIRDNRALGALVAELRSPDPTVRRACAWALGEIADSRAVGELFAVTRDHDYEVRKEAFAAVEKLGSVGVLARVISTAGGEPPGDLWPTLSPPGGYSRNSGVHEASVSEVAPDEGEVARPDALARHPGPAERDDVIATPDRAPVLADEAEPASTDQAEPASTDRAEPISADDAESISPELEPVDEPSPETVVPELPHGRPMTIAAADGTMLHAEVFGSETAPTIVLAHGWTTALRLWTHQIRELSADFRLVAYDLRGHGASAPAQSGDYSFNTFGEDLETVLAACVEPGTRAIVVGHSLGANSIAAWARRHDVEQRVRAAALLHPGLGDVVSENLLCRVTPPESSDENDPGSPSDTSARVHDAVIRHVALGPSASSALVSFYEGMLFECPPEVRAKSAIAIAEGMLDDALASLTVPTLVMTGELDRLTPPTEAATIAWGLPNLSALVELPETGHMGPLEQPEQVNLRLRELAAGAARSAAA